MLVWSQPGVEFDTDATAVEITLKIEHVGLNRLGKPTHHRSITDLRQGWQGPITDAMNPREMNPGQWEPEPAQR